MDLEFDWDEVKNQMNRMKHGIWFEEARTVFDDPLGRLFLDNSTDDERYVIVGLGTHSGPIVVIHEYSECESRIRIISARKATRHEKEFYEKRV